MTTSISIDEINDILLWKKCVFMTFNQYKTKRSHINEKIYYHEGFTNNVRTYIVEHIKNLANKLPFKKVPKPIYVLISKHIEYDETETVLPFDCKNDYDNVLKDDIIYDNLISALNNKKELPLYKNYNISCFKKDKDTFYDRNEIKKYKFIYDNLDGEKNKDMLMNSSLSSYKFNKLYEVIIYVPNLNNNLQYFTSYLDFSYHNRWMDLIVNKNSKFLSIIAFTKDYKDDVIKMIGENNYNKNKEKYDIIIENLNGKNINEYPLVKDLTNICYDMGCSSKYGEDLNEMIPAVSLNYDEQLNNARAKAPFYPTKCLKTNYYKEHMIDIQDDNEKNEYKKGLGKTIFENIDNYIKNNNDLKNGEMPTGGYSSTNIIDVIKSSASVYRNKNYNEGKNKKDYSREYNRKILTELAIRHNSYPGVQEIVFPAFRLNDDYKELIEYTHFMPWGNILLKEKYVLNEGDLLDIDKTPLTSLNNEFELKFDNLFRLSLFYKGVLKRVIINISFEKYTRRSIIFQNGSLNIYGYDSNGNNDNRYGINISKSSSISPLSIVIENNGDIAMYQNGFTVVHIL